jgi:hypothetical protein
MRRLLVTGPCYLAILMKRTTARSRNTMRRCNMWFPHNEIVAPYVSINMLWIRSSSGKGLLVEVQAERVLTGEQRNLWRGIADEYYTRNSENWRNYEMWQSWKIFSSWHTILGAHHALELCIYVEHEGYSMSLEFKLGTWVKTMGRIWYQIQMNLKTWKFWRTFPSEVIKLWSPFRTS